MKFDQWLRGLHFNVSDEPTPFPLEDQLPYRIMSDSLAFIDGTVKERPTQPFLLQISIPEPHDPEQVPAPYWNMFPPESILGRCAGPDQLASSASARSGSTACSRTRHRRPRSFGGATCPTTWARCV